MKEIICGYGFTYFTLINNEIFVCGVNISGQLGLGNNIEKFNLPEKNKILESLNIIEFCAGSSHSLALSSILFIYLLKYFLEKGECFSWGWNDYGQLDHDDENDRNQPKLIEFFKDKQISHVYCSSNSSFILSSKYFIY